MTFVGATIIEYKDQDTSSHRTCHSDGDKERIGLKGRPNVSMTLKMNLNKPGKQILEDIKKKESSLAALVEIEVLADPRVVAIRVNVLQPPVSILLEAKRN